MDHRQHGNPVKGAQAPILRHGARAAVLRRQHREAEKSRPGLRSADVLFDVWRFVGTKHPIPEEMDHCEIAVGVPMMNEV
jgi:hypothetical protein